MAHARLSRGADRPWFASPDRPWFVFRKTNYDRRCRRERERDLNLRCARRAVVKARRLEDAREAGHLGFAEPFPARFENVRRRSVLPDLEDEHDPSLQ